MIAVCFVIQNVPIFWFLAADAISKCGHYLSILAQADSARDDMIELFPLQGISRSC